MSAIGDSSHAMRPAGICKALLAALDASEGRRRKRKRDQTPDAIGLALKRELLQRAVEDDPDPDAFEEWLLNYPGTRLEPALAGLPALLRRRPGELRLSRAQRPGEPAGGVPSHHANSSIRLIPTILPSRSGRRGCVPLPTEPNA